VVSLDQSSPLRLDDAFRTDLVKRSSKRIPLAQVSALATGVVHLRQSAHVAAGLWAVGVHRPGIRPPAARELVLHEVARLTSWYEQLGVGPAGPASISEAMSASPASVHRLVESAGNDLGVEDVCFAANARPLNWKMENLDATRELQQSLVGPTRVAKSQSTLPSYAPLDVIPSQ